VTEVTGINTMSNKLVTTLQRRFETNMTRHAGLIWSDITVRIAKKSLTTLQAMEDTGGEPDVIGIDAASGAYLFADCSLESPTGRRSLCFDDAALNARKENKPKGSATQMAESMGIEILDEAQYRAMQNLFAFDLKTSSWIATPSAIRNRGGALFCDRRYDHVFTYHNGAESYYAARGFRGVLRA
jgi:hypothetical protein